MKVEEEDHHQEILDPSQIRSDQPIPDSIHLNLRNNNERNDNIYRQSMQNESKILNNMDEGISLIKIENDTLSHSEYSISTLLNTLISIAVFALIREIYQYSNITSYEIVYVKCALVTIALFIQLVYQGVYILELEHSYRTKIIVRGFLSFAGITAMYSSLHHLNNITSAIVIQMACLCIAQFFFLKHERQQTSIVIGMSLSLISLTMMFIQVIDPLVEGTMSTTTSTNPGNNATATNPRSAKTYNLTSMNMDKLFGFAQAGVSGVLLAVISYINYDTSNIRHERLQSFYAHAISACFAPFLILKDISDRKKITKYGEYEIQLLLFISILSIIQLCKIERHIIKRFIDTGIQENNDQPQQPRRMLNFGFIKPIIAIVIDIIYFEFKKEDQDDVRMIAGCALCTAISVLLLTNYKDLSLNF